MALKIIKYPNRLLRKQAAAVTQFPVDRELITQLKESLSLSDDGIAIAANQVGINSHAFVISEKFPAPWHLFFNAQYAEYSYENASAFESNPVQLEGCLSFPGLRIPVKRHYAIKITFNDESGKLHENVVVDGMLARIIQHEIDHLNGVLFIDYLPKKEKGLLIEKLLSR